MDDASDVRLAVRRVRALMMVVMTLVLSAAGASAMFASYALPDLIKASDLIVVGTLEGFDTVDAADGKQGRVVGVIRGSKVLKGKGSARRILLMVPQPGMPVSSSDISFRAGQRGLWFLRAVREGKSALYAADHPQRFVPMAEAEPVIDAVRRELAK